MSPPRVLVTGATGFFGSFVVRELRPVASVVTLARSGADIDCDVADLAAFDAVLRGCNPDFVLHLAAASRMGACAADPDHARAVNVAPTGFLARRLGPRALYVSSDLVFDGRGAPYGPLDAPAPLSVYGQTKAEGEEVALRGGGRVVRLPLLFGPDAAGRGATAMVRSAIAAGRSVTLYTNEYRTPLHSTDAARAVAALLLDPDGPQLSHFAGPERLSRWEFGRRLCALHGLSHALLLSSECQDATRPRDVSLRSDWQPPRGLDAMLLDS